jgi:phosphoribosylformylglycinamidine cyclo-ligase
MPENTKELTELTKPTTYRSTGVDIAAGNALARRIAKSAKRTHRKEVLSGVGGFAGLMAIPQNYEEPLLVSGTDGVGTKLMIAFATGNHQTVGIDLVAMCINDILTIGAEPLFFLDYVSTGKLQTETIEQVVSGIVDGCCLAGCALLGGETAEMPGMYEDATYDLAGFAVGVVERSKVVDGSQVEVEDVVIGLPSSGLHSNGYSFIRRVLLDAPSDLDKHIPTLGCTLGHELLKPTRIYAAAVKDALKWLDVKAMAHITGGGLLENPPRCIKEDMAFRFDTTAWTVPPIMELIADKGHVLLDEMQRTFNMGIGMILVIPSSDAELAQEKLAKYEARIVGTIIARTGDPVEFIS